MNLDYNNILPKVRGEYRINYDLAPITWLKVGGKADMLFKPFDQDDLALFLKQINPKTIPVTIIGACSNTLIRDGGVDGVVVKLGRNFNYIEQPDKNKIKFGAATLNNNIAKFCLQNSIAGFEFLVGIPGTGGGGIAMNAGAYGREYNDIVEEIEVVDQNGHIFSIKNSDIGFEYRKNNLQPGLIVTSITCNYEYGDKEEIKKRMDFINNSREQTQPIKEKTCGSTFANPDGHKVWQLVEKVGLKGKIIGDAQISTKHCNFLINLGKAKASDLEKLGNLMKTTIYDELGIDLRWEIKKIGKAT